MRMYVCMYTGMHEEIFKLASEGNRLTHQVKVKNTDNDRLNTTIKKLRADLTRQSKRWQTIVREVSGITLITLRT